MPNSIDLPPRPSLARAIDLENHHIGRFRTWALRLRPFDPGLSRLLDLQVEEMDDHRRTLLDMAQGLSGSGSGHAVHLVPQAPPGTRHFFVLDTGDAATILAQARTLKEKALRHYRQCMLSEPEPSTFGGVFRSLQTSKYAHLQILREAQTGYALRHPQAPSLISP